MKTRIFSQVLIIAVLVLSACSQAGTALLDPGNTPDAEIKPPTDLTDPGSDQPITGKCGRNSDEVRLLIDSVNWYCLQYPAEYDVFHPNQSEVMLFKRSLLNVSEPSVSIKVHPAGEATLEQAADQIAQVYAIPGVEPVRESLTIDGEAAILLAGLSGQDPNRQVLVRHKDQLYHFFFIEFNKSDPEYASSETLFNTVIQSFNFSPDSNACPDCPLDSDTHDDQSQVDHGSASISGWVWHDLCDSGQDGEPAPETAPEGCVREDSPLGAYHANGIMSTNELPIGGVVVTLGEGACPSTGMAEMSTIITDLSYSFTGLKAGTYCVSIDPQQREPNFSILQPGVWTYPHVSQGVVGTTVIVTPGEYKAMVNFGWDYQFQP